MSKKFFVLQQELAPKVRETHRNFCLWEAPNGLSTASDMNASKSRTLVPWRSESLTCAIWVLTICQLITSSIALAQGKLLVHQASARFVGASMPRFITRNVVTSSCGATINQWLVLRRVTSMFIMLFHIFASIRSECQWKALGIFQNVFLKSVQSGHHPKSRSLHKARGGQPAQFCSKAGLDWSVSTKYD